MPIIVERIEEGKRFRYRPSLSALDVHRQRLAETCVPLAVAQAKTAVRRGPMDMNEALSVASAAVVEAACRYDEAKAIPFPAYCLLVVRTKLKDAAAKEARYAAHHARHAEDHQDDRTADDREPDPGRVAEVMEMVDKIRRALPPEVFQLLWDVLAEGRTMAEAGRDRDVSRQRAQQVVARGLARARQICGRPAESRLAE
jgi:RNA polymerase sigma factor (sigma-70 family)